MQGRVASPSPIADQTMGLVKFSIAYTSLNDRATIFRYMWRGMMQGKSMSQGHIMQGNKKLNDPKIHPTQKPIALYSWLLKDIDKDWKIYDPNLGSGSIGIAAHRLGLNLDATENDKDMFQASSEWLRKEKLKEEYIPQLDFTSQKT